MGTHLVLVLSDRPVETEGKGVTLEGDSAGQSRGTEARPCPSNCCIGEVLWRAASQGKEGNKGAGGGEGSESHKEEGAGKGAGGVGIVGKEGMTTQGPPCVRTSREGEGGSSDVLMGVQGGDLVSTRDSRACWVLCVQAEGKE